MNIWYIYIYLLSYLILSYIICGIFKTLISKLKPYLNALEPRNLAGGRCKTWEAREKGMVGSGGTLGEKDRGCLAPRISTVVYQQVLFWDTLW